MTQLRKSKQAKDLDGNPGKRSVTVVKPPPGVPEKPPWLAGEASDEWDRVIPILDSMGVLSRLDRSAISDYCTVWGRLVQAEREIGSGSLLVQGQKGEMVRNPLLSEANQLRQRFGKYCDLLGLAPAPRGRLDIPDKGLDDDPHGLLD